MNTRTTALLAKLRGEIPAAASHPLMPAAGRESLLALLQLAEQLAGDLAALGRRLDDMEKPVQQIGFVAKQLGAAMNGDAGPVLCTMSDNPRKLTFERVPT
jgi:hypothetical protein